MKKTLIPLCILALISTSCREEKTVAKSPEPPAEPEKKQAEKEEPEDPFEDYNIEQMIEDALVWADENRTNFLDTDYEPLSKWLNERFEVKYRAMTPELIFDQVPLSDIHYELVNLPDSVPAFNFESPNVSRRELLSVIAKHWDLDMGYKTGSDGNPEAVVVTGL